MFDIVALPTDVVERWRRERRDDHGNVLVPEIADRPHAFPCRHCLQDAEPGEEMLLASHSPFTQPGPYKEVGPVFVHARACARFCGGGVPEQLRRRLLAVRAYDGAQRMIDAVVVEGSAVDGELARLAARDDAALVHVRFARPGCFACRVERRFPEGNAH